MGTMGLSASIAVREKSADVAMNGRKSLICGSFGSTKRMRVGRRDSRLGAKSETRLSISQMTLCAQKLLAEFLSKEMSMHRLTPIRDLYTATHLTIDPLPEGLRRRIAVAIAMDDVDLPGREDWLQAVGQRLFRGLDTAADRQSLARALMNGELLGRR